MPSVLVVKSGLKIRLASGDAIPVPVSATDTVMRSASFVSDLTLRILGPSFAAIASTAFMIEVEKHLLELDRFPLISGSCLFGSA